MADDYLNCFELLKKAEALSGFRDVISDRDIRLKQRAITLNNLGCFFKRRALPSARDHLPLGWCLS